MVLRVCNLRSNTLHHSPPNRSDSPTRRLLCAYNALSNPVTAGNAHPAYTPVTPASIPARKGFLAHGPKQSVGPQLAVWPDSCVKEYGEMQVEMIRSGEGVLDGRTIVERDADGQWVTKSRL